MIISASRRTDIPTYYSERFFNRLREEYVMVRNPMNMHQISRISLNRDLIDAVVFWTKNPIPMLNKLEAMESIPYYFQFTVTPYGTDMEPNIPDKDTVIIPAFQKLAEKIGRERVIWRYDPIFFTETYNSEFHVRAFEHFSKLLHGYTEKCIVSFLDLYANTARNTRTFKIHSLNQEEQIDLMRKFVKVAAKNHIQIETCAEKVDLEALGIKHAHCIDGELLEKIIGCRLNLRKDPNQRMGCGCISSIDIGAYNTCRNGCYYCYANMNNLAAQDRWRLHDPKSPLLFGKLESGDVVKDRKVFTNKDAQISIFDL